MENSPDPALDGVHANLDELRQEIVRYLMVTVIALGLYLAWTVLPKGPLDVPKMILWLSLSLTGIAVHLLSARSPKAARHVLVWGCLAWLLVAIALLREPWLPFFSLLGILLGSVLVSGSEFAYAGATILLVMALNYGAGVAANGAQGSLAANLRAVSLGIVFPTSPVALALVLGVVCAQILRKTLFTALEWYFLSRQRTDALLKETREHRAEISRAYKSLELAYHIQQKIQDELVYANRRADEALQMKERFAANISHELRTPLNLILGFSEVMYKSPETYGNIAWPPILRRDIYQIYRSSEHLLEMIDDVLDLSRYEMLDFSLVKETVSIGKVVEEALTIGRDLFTGSGIRLETNLAPDLPIVYIDVTRIRQVLINLLKNARSFTTEGFVRISARLTGEGDRPGDGRIVDGAPEDTPFSGEPMPGDRPWGDRILISVKDTGVGIPPEKLEAIFSEFYQVDQSRASRHQGAGLGLAICKRLVEAHGGRIWVESSEGLGTEFFFSLPLPSQRYRYSLIETPGLVLQPETKPCALVVEADPVIVRIISRQLNDLEAIQVDDPARVEEYARRCHPCLVIDNTFQRKDAFQGKDQPGAPAGPAAPALHLEEPVPVLQVSLPSQAWLAKELEISSSLIKPVTSARFLSVMSRYPEARDILIVDDDREFCQLIHRYLQSSGKSYRVRFAYDGQEGWAALVEQPPDLVILDVIMPGLNGFEIIEQMKQDRAFDGTRTVLITGTHFDRDIQEKYESQIHIYQQNGLSYRQSLECIKALAGALGSAAGPQNR